MTFQGTYWVDSVRALGRNSATADTVDHRTACSMLYRQCTVRGAGGPARPGGLVMSNGRET
jgi:hypothetical protein